MRNVCLLLTVCLLPAWPAEPVFHIPPVTSRLDFQGQPLQVTVSGTIWPVGDALHANLSADLTELQRNLTALLAAQLNQSNRCGERLTIERATLAPVAPSGMLTAAVHFEKWGCAKAFGKEMVKKLVAGDGTVGVKLTPEVADGGTLRLAVDVTSVDATGPVGDLLRSGSLGDAVREKIRASLVAALQKSTDLKTTLPEAVQEIAVIRRAEFRDGGEGRLMLSVESEIHMSEEHAAAVLEHLKALEGHGAK